MTQVFNAGDTAWTTDGRKVYVSDRTVSGGYVVQACLDTDFADPEYGSPVEYGAPELVGQLLPNPPVEVFDAAVKAMSEQLTEGREELRRIALETQGAHRERQRLLSKLSQVPALKHIEDILDGKFGWMVTRSGNPAYLISTMEQGIASLDRYARGEKRLLTLFGNAKGNLQWKINQYTDGSGFNTEVWLCATEEEARALARDMLTRDLVEMHQTYLEKKRTGELDHWTVKYVVNYAGELAALGGDVPEPVALNLTQIKLDAIDTELARLAKDSKHYTDQINALQAERWLILEGEKPSDPPPEIKRRPWDEPPPDDTGIFEL